MPTSRPDTELDPRYGDPGARPVSWAEAERQLAAAEVSWISTVRPDGRPHVTTLLTVWRDGALHFCSGVGERKTRNLETNPHVVLTTGTNALHGGMDIVVEGRAETVTDRDTLRALAAAWGEKYGESWHFEVIEGGFESGTGPARVFRVEPETAFGFGKDPYSQTRWAFGR
jgi:nitroimidazol reductase NimA-like FMN-containing flavoprotein (pyridoxamine 5'-phosphate oxidase superfamily)